MALTSKGYKRESYEDILERLDVKAKELFGQDANTGARSALGILLRIMAFVLALVWQDNENVYYSGFRKTAEGRQLDALLPYAGITRNPATYADGPVVFSGAPGTPIEMGFTVGKENETLYYTLEDAVIGPDGMVSVDVICQVSGAIGNADAGQINQIINPIDGLEGVTNPIAFTNGKEQETDQEVRERADTTVEGLGSGTTASIRTELLEVSGVRAAYVDENYNDEANIYGTPSRAIQAFVLGGSDEDVAQAVFKKKAGGIKPFGQTFVTILDDAEQPHQVGLTRAQTVQIYAKVTLKTNNSFESDGQNQVIKAIVQYIGGTDAESNTYIGLNMGEDVILSKLIAKLYGVNGIDDVDVQLSVDGSQFNASNVEIQLQQVAQITAANIEVI
ncbi:baseplate J/gp47 family protein [Rummeliibacillus sp. G93]|uniref:baseplate J/gp47 family protein n=1 Tax=Rummeliibacillus sp. G93 TaxID=2939494 RepID=UPI00201BC9C5|nr:baseplate J/gp47 family protein [Rummeliibacillus sp. G93]UQW98192.1 baseplate J/gp47 family protein [Rummeliibacillus sp. G93]